MFSIHNLITMKRLVKLTAAFLLCISFTSCRKYYSCICNTIKNGKPWPVDAGYIQGIKRHARNVCERQMKERYEAGGFEDVDCKLQ